MGSAKVNFFSREDGGFRNKEFQTTVIYISLPEAAVFFFQAGVVFRRATNVRLEFSNSDAPRSAVPFACVQKHLGGEACSLRNALPGPLSADNPISPTCRV